MVDAKPYGHKEYWDEHYAARDGEDASAGFPTWDWLGDLGVYLGPVRAALDPAKDRVLIAGCGNSEMPFQLVQLGFAPERVVSVDYSQICVERMRTEAWRRGLPGLAFEVSDVRDLSAHPDGTFDAVIDKATLDTVYCIDRPMEHVERYAREVLRILRPGGAWVIMTQNETRSMMLEGMRAWDVEFHRVLRNPEALKLGLDIPPVYQNLFIARKRPPKT